MNTKNTMTENEISRIIFDCALKVHKMFGPGLLESAYEECMFYELKKAGLKVEKQKPLPLIYEDIKLEVGYRIDLLVENKVIIENKSVDALNDIHLAFIQISSLRNSALSVEHCVPCG